jgi:hypothetical protein
MLRRLLRAVAGVIAACAPSESESFVGGWDDVDEYVRRLANAPEYGVLIIGVQGSEDFVQFSASDESVQMDFPLVTVAQQAREAAMRAFFEARDTPIMENHGSDGERFLDVELSGDPERIAEVTRDVLADVFDATPADRLHFDGHGLGGPS